MRKDLVTPLIILAALALGCSKINELVKKSGNEGPANSNTGIAKPDDKPAESGAYAPTDNPKVDIANLSDRFMTLKSFRAVMEGDGQTPIKADLEFVAPDRYRFKSANSMEMIIIGKTTYMKLGDRWQKMPMALDSSITDMRATFNKEGLKWFNDVKYVGDDTIDGKPAYVYTYHGKGLNNTGENDSKLWIAKSDGLPLKIEATYKSGTLKSMTIEYDYDTPVTIEPPVN